MRIKYYFVLLNILLLTCLAGCGYQLRGYNASKLNISHLFLDHSAMRASEINNRFLNSLTTNLQLQNVEVRSVKDPKHNNKLEITSAVFTKNIISTASSKLITQYQMSYIITFNFYQDNKRVLTNQIVNTSRNYNYTQDQILGLADEEEVLTHEMIAEAINRIITQLNLTTK